MVQVSRPSSHRLQLPLGLRRLDLDHQLGRLHCHRDSNSLDTEALDDSQWLSIFFEINLPHKSYALVAILVTTGGRILSFFPFLT